MKKAHILTITYLLIAFFCSAQSEKQYTITGQIKGLPNGTDFYLIRNDNGKSDTVSSVKSNREEFVFKGKLKPEGEIHFIKIDTSVVRLAEGKNSYVTLLLDHSDILMTGELLNWPDVFLSGSKATREYNEAVRSFKQAYKTFAENWSNSNDSLIKNAALESYGDLFIKYVRDHPSSFVSAYLISRNEKILGLKKMNIAYSNLSTDIQNSYYGHKLKSQLKTLTEITNTRAELVKQGRGLEIGQLAPDINGFTPEGKPLSLGDVVAKNKLTLLEFWASWCIPCVASIPNIKEVYTQYNDKGFNVLGVTIDNNLKAWRFAIEKNAIPWDNISDLNNKKISLAEKIYNISSIPQNFLLDSNGRIIAVNLIGDNLLKKVAEFMDKQH